ncbi:hypothetical protein CEUSTIGMA_g3479.t1 [Chlamydomonas eustigma]|uniref:Protein SirB1 N-terminal domain-containing protein n=1 Tax=Chlamydomonas eustigma TaxID=1157962 RepID=A0A250WZ27_9CHLO|nr:hypothetical protein CEUSTIGMA_g3479.t1 [Chlamydomonas eustigma]|eukprot:GAX76036.1 hypothetical protein CEUSTIGMA_g3479.t1 [Chlamydomonas eustigma]
MLLKFHQRSSCIVKKKKPVTCTWRAVLFVDSEKVLCKASQSAPQKWSDVEGWAHHEFIAEVKKGDCCMDVGRACLLLALEEEAAVEMHPELMSSLKEVNLTLRTMGSASTWSLERLQALAEEAKAEYIRDLCSSDGLSASSLVEDQALGILFAVNRVLFERHGYAPCNRYGQPRDSQLSSVMESGFGSSATLSFLYMEVCKRAGLSMEARALEDGRYLVLWPKNQELTVNGKRFVVDPYGGGALLLEDEVCELFDVEKGQLFIPSSSSSLLASLLGDLRDSHWARAVGGSATPGFMLPLTLETALKNKVGSINIHSMKRAVSTAEKRLHLLSGQSAVQLEYALLQYFSGNYDDAWIELGILLEQYALSVGTEDDVGRPHRPEAGEGTLEMSNLDDSTRSSTTTSLHTPHDEGSALNEVDTLGEKRHVNQHSIQQGRNQMEPSYQSYGEADMFTSLTGEYTPVQGDRGDMKEQSAAADILIQSSDQKNSSSVASQWEIDMRVSEGFPRDVETVLDTDTASVPVSFSSGHNVSDVDLTQEQILQIKVLLEKVRLQLTFFNR